MSLEEVEQMWESLPKVDGGDSIDLAGFARFSQQARETGCLCVVHVRPPMCHFRDLPMD